MKFDSNKLLSKSKEKQNEIDMKICMDNNIFIDEYDDIHTTTSEEIKIKNKKEYLNDNKNELKIITELVNISIFICKYIIYTRKYIYTHMC
jgi:hypothetical protein